MIVGVAGDPQVFLVFQMITNYVQDIKLPMGYLLDIGGNIINSLFFW